MFFQNYSKLGITSLAGRSEWRKIASNSSLHKLKSLNLLGSVPKNPLHVATFRVTITWFTRCKANEPSKLHAVLGSRIRGGRKTMTSRCSHGPDTASRKRKTADSERSKHGKAQAVRTQEKRRACKLTRRCALLCPKEQLLSARIIVSNGTKTRTGRTSENMVSTLRMRKRCFAASSSSRRTCEKIMGRAAGLESVRSMAALWSWFLQNVDQRRFVSSR